jgi:pimeloyl-ACP methyl ester carboxylesterase
MKKSKGILATTMVTGALVMQGAVLDAQPAPSPRVENSTAIRPFRFEASEQQLADLKRRIKTTILPEKETVNDLSQGVQLETIEALADYWATTYDWRRVETQLNALPNFITEIDGLDIHFVHVRSKHKNALPILVSHGWPGSVIEQLKLIGPLTDPTAYGGKAEDAFDVVIPSMPGYGFSGKPTTTGWGPDRIAKAWVTLMKRLGYKKFLAQGGDWGSLVVELMAIHAPDDMLGIHANMPGVIPTEIDKAAFAGQPAPAGLSADEKFAYDRLSFFYKDVYYAFYMGWHPQSMVGISDSPVGLATLMIDHDRRSLELIARSFAGKKEGLTRDDVLDNITLFWLTNSGVSAARLYWENKHPFFAPRNVKIPVAVSAFRDELYQAPKSWAEKAYSNLIYYKKHDKGGHFAAWEQPELLVADLRSAFKSLRK